MSSKVIEYFLNDNYSFSVTIDEKGRKIGKLVSLENEKILATNLMQRVFPESIPNLLNVAKVVISAAWQDGKILPEEREAFDLAFKNVAFTEAQRAELEREFEVPTPIYELIKDITLREHKMLILETSLLLIIADGEFHPKEKEFIQFLAKEFSLDKEDYALLYRILPQRVKKYIVKENLTTGLDIRADEIDVITKYASKHKVENLKHEYVYSNLLVNWRDRRTRYSRIKSY